MINYITRLQIKMTLDSRFYRPINKSSILKNRFSYEHIIEGYDDENTSYSNYSFEDNDLHIKIHCSIDSKYVTSYELGSIAACDHINNINKLFSKVINLI